MNVHTAPAVQIPAAVYTFTEVVITMAEVQTDDAIKDRIVKSIKRGPKNVELLNDEGKRIAYGPHAQEIKVIRSEETAESGATRDRARRNKEVQDWMNSYVENGEQKAALAKLMEKAEKGYIASSFDMAALVGSQAEDTVNGEVYATVANLMDGEEVDYVDAIEQVRKNLTKRVLMTAAHGGTSRSTSQTSNLMDDALASARANFLSDWRLFS